MAISNPDYWRKRAEANFTKAEKAGYKFVDEANKASLATQKNIQLRLESFYAKYADNNRVSLAEARKYLTSQEVKEYKGNLNKYIEQVKKYGGDPIWQRELRNQSIKHRIRRIESLMTSVKAQIENLYVQQESSSSELLSEIYTEGFLEEMYDIHKGIGFATKFDAPDIKSAQKAVETNWSGSNFSSLWGENKRKLEGQLATIIPQAFTAGRTVRDLSLELSDKMRVSRSSAERLIRTECGRISNQTSVDAYKEAGVEEYTILATLDNRTSEICQALDGEKFTISEAETGISLPPFHPNCRTTTTPYFEDIQELGDRIARDSSGNNIKVSPRMTYSQWKRELGIESSNSLALTSTEDSQSNVQSYHNGKDLTQNYSENQLNQEFDMITEIMEAQGFQGLPTLVSDSYLDDYLTSSDSLEIFRGLSSNNVDDLNDYVNGFFSGDFAISGEKTSVYGRGSYFAGGLTQAKEYANHDSSVTLRGESNQHKFIIRAALRKESKVLVLGEGKEWEEASSHVNTRCSSNWVAAKGYDAILIGKGERSQILVLNRTALLVSETNHYEEKT